MAVHRKPRAQPPNVSIIESKPFFRVLVDLVEISPTGVDGERYVVTFICAAAKYPCFRCSTSRDTEDLAWILLDIVLDVGVVPGLWQSDNEFAAAAIEELVHLMGSRQVFSTALRPQTNAIIERPHRELRSGLAVLVEALARAAPRTWPQYIRWLEHRTRHKTVRYAENLTTTPYAAVHGFYGSTALQTALTALDKIPEELVVHDWLQTIVQESKRLCTALKNHFVEEAKTTTDRLRETKPELNFKTGDLVLMQKPFFEKGQGLILPQCDGPFMVAKQFNPHTVTLCYPLTGSAILNGTRVSTSRLVHYNFPVEALYDLQDEIIDAPAEPLAVGDFVAVELKVNRIQRIKVAKIQRIFEVGDQLEVLPHEVPPGDRFGPWSRRPWHPEAATIVVPRNEVLCTVDLRDRALTPGSLEKLEALGVQVSAVLRDDKTLPPRQAG